jgi:hypothetical protein
MSPVQNTDATTNLELSTVVVNLLKGPIYQDTHERAWALLLHLHRQVADYVAVLGLQVHVDGQWLADFDIRLDEYLDALAVERGGEA